MSIQIENDTRFQGRVIIITGAGGNFGREGCIYFALRRAHVVALDNNMTTLEETASIVQEQCKNASHIEDGEEAKIICRQCDVTKPESVEAAVEEATKTFGTPDLLWNNAGYQGQIVPTLEYDVNDFATVMNVNVTGMFTVLQAVAKRMAQVAKDAKEKGDDGAQEGKESRKFAIVNTASVAAMRGTPAMIAYASSKAAILAMTVSAAKDLSPYNIRVNAISPALIGPGFMWTRQNELHAKSGSPYFSNDPETVAKGKVNSVPMKRLGSIDEVVKSVAFLLSDESSYTTAFNLVVDGGMSGGLH